MNLFFKKTLLPRQEDALPGRQQTMPVTNRHLVTNLKTLWRIEEKTGGQRFSQEAIGLGPIPLMEIQA